MRINIMCVSYCCEQVSVSDSAPTQYSVPDRILDSLVSTPITGLLRDPAVSAVLCINLGLQEF